MTSATRHFGNKSIADRARDATSEAQEKVTAAASTTVEAAKDHPYAAAGIVAGVVAAVGGAAYAATKMGSANDPGPVKTKSAKPKPKAKSAK